jgi:hypothetical protein
MAITPLPTPPSRDDPANFAARGDAFLGALPDFATELNDALPTINDAIPASEIAVALVNYKGDYSASTTYLVGQSVTYTGIRFLSKKTNLNITPVDGNDWYELSAGVETTVRSILNQSSAITLLTSDGGGYLLVSGTAVINLNLPNATTLLGRTFVIKNIGSFAMLVYDAAGNYLFPIAPSTAVAIWASDISTSAGQWAIQTIPPDYITTSSQIAIYGQGVGLTKTCVAKISTSQQVFAYYRQVDSTGSKPYAMIVTQSGGTLTFGTSYLIADEEASSPTVSMCTATTGVMSWMGPSSVRACVITVSGTTITAGTPITVYSSAIYGNNKTEGASATTAFLAFCQTSAIITGVALTISGTTLSAGSAVVLNTGRNNDGQDFFLGIGSTTFGNVCYTTTGSELFGTGFTISGSTITAGTPTALNGGTVIGQVTVYGCTLSASKFAIMYYDGVTATNLMIRCVNWSGTTPTSASAQQAIAVNSNAYSFQVGAMSSTSGVIAYNKGGGVIYLKGWTLSTNTFTFGTEFAGPSAITNTYQVNNLVGFSAPDFGTPATATYMSHYQYQIGSNMQTLTLSGTTVSQTSTRYMVSASNATPHLRSPKSMCSLSTTRALTLIGIIGDGPSQFGFGVVLQDCSTATPTVLQTLFIGTTKTPTLYSITALSATQALVTFTSSTGTQEAQVITMSGNTISLGTQLQVSSSTTCIDTTVTRLSTTTAICVWRNNTSENRAVVLSVSGSTITAGTSNTFSTGTITFPFIEGLSATSAIVAYTESYTKANVFSISGTTITAGPMQVLDIGETSYNYLSALSSTKCVLATGSGSVGANACVAVLTISGNTVTAGVRSLLTYTYWGFKVACLTSKSGILIQPYTATSRSFVISNNAISMGEPQPCLAYIVSALQTPATGSPSATRVITQGDTGYDLVQGTIYSTSGAVN